MGWLHLFQKIFPEILERGRGERRVRTISDHEKVLQTFTNYRPRLLQETFLWNKGGDFPLF